MTEPTAAAAPGPDAPGRTGEATARDESTHGQAATATAAAALYRDAIQDTQPTPGSVGLATAGTIPLAALSLSVAPHVAALLNVYARHTTDPTDIDTETVTAALLDTLDALASTMTGQTDPTPEREETIARTLAELVTAWARFTVTVGFGPGTHPDDLTDPVLSAFAAAGTHDACPAVCPECGEQLAATPCTPCNGSGCGPGTATGACEECEYCAGVGKVHTGCVGLTYDDLAARVAGRRPAHCCGTCPPVAGGGYDCTCRDNPRCPGPPTVEDEPDDTHDGDKVVTGP